MLIEKISEKNNLINVSHYNELSENLKSHQFNVKTDGDIFWKFNEEMIGEVFMEINFIEPTEVFEIEFNVDGSNAYSELEIKHSLDGKNWYEYQNGNTDITPKFVKLSFFGVMPGFCLNKLKIYGEEKYTIGNELISLSSRRYYPQRFFEKYNGIPQMVHHYLEMLECNQFDKTIRRFFESCLIDVSLIFDDDESVGTINSFPINTIPINAGSSSSFDGMGAAVINRIGGSDSLYDLNGRITDQFNNPSSISLKFHSTVECEDKINCSRTNRSHNCNNPILDRAQYHWEFDDEYASNISNNPTTLPVLSYGEIIHSFSMLGYYNIKFLMKVDDVFLMGNQFIEISPSPYVIVGDYYAQDDSIYIIYGLTAWPTTTYRLPTITRRDINNTPSTAQLIDNGDRTFTVVSNGETEPCKIRIFDEYYEEYRELDITFEAQPSVNALLDSHGNAILDSGGNFITTN